MSRTLLERLDRCKGYFHPNAARETLAVLERGKRTRFRLPGELIHFHETVLFLRAYPQDEHVLRLCDEILFSFGERLCEMDREPFEYAEVSGIAGTGLTTNFSYPFARSLAERHGKAINIDWDHYEYPERLGRTLAKLIPEAGEDWAIAPHSNWRKWYESADGNLKWLIKRIDPEIYDLLDLSLRWELGDSNASRSRARLPRRDIYYHSEPLLARKDVSFEAEFGTSAIRTTQISRSHAQRILNLIIDASAVRYRELYGFLYPDLDHMFHANLGRGMDFFFFGTTPEWHLPKREYSSGMYFKNGVPMGYIEVMWINGQMEVGFNLYYTFRQGETAWLYVRLLKLLHEQFQVMSFSIDSYQLGSENDEAIESGAFWFYYKLGFRSASEEIERIAEREAKKVAAHRDYRTPPRILRKLATVPLIYEIGGRRPANPIVSSIAAATRSKKSS